MSEGVDYAYPPHPTPGELVKAGKVFVVRYGGVGSTDKWLTAEEAKALSDEGISLVANAEYSQAGLLGGYNVGYQWASKASKYFGSLGMPDDKPIYLSVDFQPEDSTQWTAIYDAFRGAIAAIGLPRVGVYGSYEAVKRMASRNLAKWYWQTYAWSGGLWFVGNHLEQYHNGVTLGHGNVDLCRSKKNDYGQWRIGTMTDSWSIADAHAARDRIASSVNMEEDIPFGTNGLPDKNELVLFLKGMSGKLDTLLGRSSTVVMSDLQMEALAVSIAGHLGIGADQVKNAVKAALREGTA